VSRAETKGVQLQTREFDSYLSFKMRQGYLIIGGIIAATVAGGVGYYFVNHKSGAAIHRAYSSQASLASRSKAYHFGFIHAALSGCRFKAGRSLDEFSALIERNGQGVVPEELKAGFAEFYRLQQTSEAGGCSLAERLFGPRGYLHPGILEPHNQ